MSALRRLFQAPCGDPKAIGSALNVIDGILWLALIYVMVTKPFT